MDRSVGDLQPTALRETVRQLGWREGMELEEMLCQTGKCCLFRGKRSYLLDFASHLLLDLILLNTCSRAVEIIITDHLSPLME